MSVFTQEEQVRLRLAGIGGPLELGQFLTNGERIVVRRFEGAFVLDPADPKLAVPEGATVIARVNRPVELPEVQDLAGAGASPPGAPAQVVAAGGRTLTFVAGPPGTITASSGDFLADGYRPGMRLFVAGTTSNDGTYLIQTVTPLVITTVEALAAEGPLSGGETLDGTPNLAQQYRWERAPRPDTYTIGGVAFTRTRQRVLNVLAGSSFEEHQAEPVWAAFPTPQEGALVQWGKALNILPTRGQVGDTPDLAPPARDLIRLRWVGTPVAGATLVAAAAGEGPFESPGGAPGFGWPSGHRNLVPGSIVVTLDVGGTMRDDGKGRLVAEDGSVPAGDGVVDYLTGAFSFSTPGNIQAGAITVDYEHECPYFPLDAMLQWDALMASH